MNSDIKPDFEKLVHDCYTASGNEHKGMLEMSVDLMENIWTDHVEPLLSTVKRLQEENEAKKQTIKSIRELNETIMEDLRTKNGMVNELKEENEQLKEKTIDECKTIHNQLNQSLTKREVFAMAAMQGLLSNPHYVAKLEQNMKDKVIYDMNAMCAREAVDMSDELLKQLES